MSTNTTVRKKITVQDFKAKKEKGEKITMLTVYDYTMAKIVDMSGVDAVLVGDSAGNVMAGYETTLSVTIDEMIYHAKSVKRALNNALLVVDMPFGTCSGDPLLSLQNAIRIMRESGAAALKIEGGEEILPDIKKIVAAGIPVMGHLGLMPQSVHKFGGFGLRATSNEEVAKLKKDAELLENAGCFAITLEKVPASIAAEISTGLSIPVIGIGAGQYVDGQVLVLQDMLGMSLHKLPKFVRRYADLALVMKKALDQYTSDVRNGNFPTSDEAY